MHCNSSTATKLAVRSLPCIALSVGALWATDSFAGRDAGQMIAQAKANKEAIARRATAPGAASSLASEALPLDHGPRATTTPWLNQQRRMRAQADANPAKGPVATGN